MQAIRLTIGVKSAADNWLMMKKTSIAMILIVASVLGLGQTKNKDEQTQARQETTSMSQHAKATFTIKSWNEKPVDEIWTRIGAPLTAMPKLTRASVSKFYQGDITGEGRVEYLMMYRDDGSATFIGLERVVGRVGDRSGSFVLQHSGIFERGLAKANLSVVSGSGTEGLRALAGEGEFAVGHERAI